MRRMFASLLAMLLVMMAIMVLMTRGAGADRGIGGTYVPPQPQAPRPVPGGTTKPVGTTVVGTIVRFGSVHVNGLVLDLPEEAMHGLALGQTVRLASPDPIADRMRAERVTPMPSLVGPVDAVYAKGSLTVLGRRVAIDRGTFLEEGLVLDLVPAGTMLEVHGLEAADGALRATRIERAASDARPMLRGRLTPGADGALAVAGLRVAAGASADWIGRVVVAEVEGGRRVATVRGLWEPLAEPAAADLSIEGVVGSDLRPEAMTIEGATIALDRSTIVREARLLQPGAHVVVECTRAANGGWRAARVEAPPVDRTAPALPSLPPDLPFTPPPPVPPIPGGMGATFAPGAGGR
jgi:Domain of unknown function (DUF5666)